MGNARHYEIADVEPLEIYLGTELFCVRPIGATSWRRFLQIMIGQAPTVPARGPWDDLDPADRAEARAKEQERLVMLYEAGHAEQLFSILERHMDPAEYERLERFCEARSVSIDLLAQVIKDCVEDTGNRPTTPDSPSPAGPSGTGDGSTDPVSSPDSTSTPSPSTDG